MPAQNIARAILDKTPIADLGAEVGEMEAAYRVQTAVITRLASRFGGVGGYKIAWNAPGAYTPAVGQVFRDLIRPNGANIAENEIAELAVEPEIIAVIGHDVTKDGQNAKSIESHISRYHAGFEILDRRNTQPELFANKSLMVANNILNFGLVLGAGKPALPIHLETVLTLNDVEIFHAKDATPQHPAAAVAFIANHLIAHGSGLKVGDLVLCGTHYPPFVVQAKATLEVAMGALGGAKFSFG